MGRARALGYAATIALSFSSVTTVARAAKPSKAEIAAVAATPAEIAAKALVQNDPLDTIVRIDTSPFYQEKRGLLGVVSADKYMRAAVDKKTGETSYQLVVWSTYYGNEWIFIDRVNYETPVGPLSAETHVLNRDVGSCSRLMGCQHTEAIAADIPEATLQQVAAEAVPGVDASWTFRIYGKTGEGVTTGILRTEVAGILIAVDQERRRLGVK